MVTNLKGLNMKEFNSAEEILDFAIAGEIEANEFYLDLAAKMHKPAMKKVFEEFAAEEASHKAKLEAVKTAQFEIGAGQDVPSLGIADYSVDTKPTPDMSYADALILAMKNEKAAYRLYLDLASVASAEELTSLFLSLAQEEAKHKLRFEIEYDDVILQEN